MGFLHACTHLHPLACHVWPKSACSWMTRVNAFQLERHEGSLTWTPHKRVMPSKAEVFKQSVHIMALPCFGNGMEPCERGDQDDPIHAQAVSERPGAVPEGAQGELAATEESTTARADPRMTFIRWQDPSSSASMLTPEGTSPDTCALLRVLASVQEACHYLGSHTLPPYLGDHFSQH
jgi:hypothetical protein